MPSAAPPVNSARRFAHIDALRAYAVLVVVVAHGGLGQFVPGGSGVTIFFSISGFIITYLLLKERDQTGGFRIGRFYLRRVFKIMPPLLLAVVLPSLLWAIWNQIDWGAFFAQIFFIFNWWKIHNIPDVMPGTGVVWSLSIEEQFYIVFALVWLTAVRSPHWARVTVLVASIAVVWSTIARIAFAGDSSRIYYGSDTRLDGIAYGVLTAVLYHAWQRRGESDTAWVVRIIGSPIAPFVAVAAYVATLAIRDEWFRDTFRFTVQSLAACALILYGLTARSGLTQRAISAISLWKPVEVIGLASYSIYLVHLTVILLFQPALGFLPSAVSASLLMVVGVTTGIAMYYWVEKPVHAARLALEAQLGARKADNLLRGRAD